MLAQKRQCCQQVKQPRCSFPARLSLDDCCSGRNVQHCEGVFGDLRPAERKKTALGQTNPAEQKQTAPEMF